MEGARWTKAMPKGYVGSEVDSGGSGASLQEVGIPNTRFLLKGAEA